MVHKVLLGSFHMPCRLRRYFPRRTAPLPASPRLEKTKIDTVSRSFMYTIFMYRLTLFGILPIGEEMQITLITKGLPRLHNTRTRPMYRLRLRSCLGPDGRFADQAVPDGLLAFTPQSVRLENVLGLVRR